MQRARPTPAGAVARWLLLAAVTGLSACGGSGRRTALAIDEVRWKVGGEIVVTTECATELEYEVGPDHSGVGLLELTLWGEPTVGTCHPSVTVQVPPGTTRIVDGTTSMVVDLPPAEPGG